MGEFYSILYYFPLHLNVKCSETLTSFMCRCSILSKYWQLLFFFFKLCICRLCSTGKLQQVCSAAAVWQGTRAAPTSQLKRIRLVVGACWYVVSVRYWTANFQTVVIYSLSLLFVPLNLHLLFTPRPRSCFLAPASMQEWEVLLGDRLAPSFQEAECGTSTLRV